MNSLKKTVVVDCAFGGMIYAIVDIEAHPFLPEIAPRNGKILAQIGEEIKTTLKEKHPVAHPNVPSYQGPDILVFTSDIKRSVHL